MIVVAVVQLVIVATGTQYGFDFRGGTWQAGHAVLLGRSPYPPPDPASLVRIATGFITPPLLALVGAPFSLLPFTMAAMIWSLACVAALAAAFRLLGVTDRRFYVLAFCSFPVVSSVVLGQPDCLFALLAAIAWRYRDSPGGAIAGGALIAAKLLAWPLVFWLLATRRFRLAGLTTVSAAGWLLVSWACIGFKGLTAYPRLLAADAHAYGFKSHSFVAAIGGLGASRPLAQLLAILLALAVGAAVVVVSRGQDEGWFTAALAVGLLVSPVMWQHYVVLLFVPLAISHRLRDPLIWLAVIALWLSPAESPPTIWQMWLVPVLACAIAIRGARADSARQARPSFIRTRALVRRPEAPTLSG
jgi:alpha-1,2-mannosyltransferase